MRLFLTAVELISLLFYFQRMVFLDYYAAPQAAYYAIPNREIFRGNLYHHFSSLQNDPYATKERVADWYVVCGGNKKRDRLLLSDNLF